jgi:hypothetical protein
LDGWPLTSPSGQWMGPTADQQKRAAESARRFGKGVANGVVGLKDTAVGLGYGVKQIVTNPAEYWDDLKNVVTNMPDAIAESGVQTYYEIKSDPGKIDEIAGEASFNVLVGVLAGKGVDKLAKFAKLKLSPGFQTNDEFVQTLANRAEAWGDRKGLPRTGSGPGIEKHGYAEKLLNRYQRRFGSRGLTPEVRYINGALWERGLDPVLDSIKLDVVEGPLDSPTSIWDYKFGDAELKPGRIKEIRTKAGLPPDVPVQAVKPE